VLGADRQSGGFPPVNTVGEDLWKPSAFPSLGAIHLCRSLEGSSTRAVDDGGCVWGVYREKEMEGQELLRRSSDCAPCLLPSDLGAGGAVHRGHCGVGTADIPCTGDPGTALHLPGGLSVLRWCPAVSPRAGWAGQSHCGLAWTSGPV
jgi:hypothetical protein